MLSRYTGVVDWGCVLGFAAGPLSVLPWLARTVGEERWRHWWRQWCWIGEEGSKWLNIHAGHVHGGG